MVAEVIANFFAEKRNEDVLDASLKHVTVRPIEGGIFLPSLPPSKLPT